MEDYDKIKKTLAVAFMHDLDANRPEGKMCLSNGECADIEKAFNEQDWPKLARYLDKNTESEDEWIPKELIEYLKQKEDYRSCWIAWLEKQKEQKPVEYLDKDKVYAIMKKLHDLSFSQNILINSKEYKQIDEITHAIRLLLDYPIEQKPAEWSEEDERMLKSVIWHLRYSVNNGDIEHTAGQLEFWLKSLRPRQNPIVAVDAEQLLKILPPKPKWSEEDERIMNGIQLVLESWDRAHSSIAGLPSLIPSYISWLKSLRPQSNQEWSEKDKKVYSRLLNHYESLTHCVTTADRHQEIREELNFLKSICPSWKPSEKQMNCLCAAVDAAIRKHNESVSGYEPARVLKSLYEDLKKL